MTIKMIISGSRSVLSLMGRVWFNCNRVFNRFGFIFSNPKRVWVLLALTRLYFKNIFYYFILYFNINNNNN